MKKALVVGINNYPTYPLLGCINDATAFKSVIESNGDGSPNFDVKFLSDVQTKSELKGLIVDLFEGDSDAALFYFSGKRQIKHT
ncbi:caspase family protein [Virgibacillus oceani]